MFLEPEDLGQSIYGYQVEEITEGDDNLVLQALKAGVQEARGYLTPNINDKKSYDGRPLYNVNAIFGATGNDREAIIVKHCATLAKWHLVELCNADVIYEHAKERYDRAISWFDKVANGSVILDELPTITLEDTPEIKPYSSGSRLKFNHE